MLVTSEDITCGNGWVTVHSRLTAQELRVEVEKECDVACGTLLGAILSLLKPYLSTLVSVAAVIGAYLYGKSMVLLCCLCYCLDSRFSEIDVDWFIHLT